MVRGKSSTLALARWKTSSSFKALGGKGQKTSDHIPCCSHVTLGIHMLFYFSVCITDLLVVPEAFYSFFIQHQLKQAATVRLDLCGGEAESPNQTAFPALVLVWGRQKETLEHFTLCLQVATSNHSANSWKHHWQFPSDDFLSLLLTDTSRTE